MIEKAPSRASALRLLLGLSALSVSAFLVRLYAARTVGFGDSEALYASYAAYPQPAYVDHPGLVGLLARALGGGSVPSPLVTHTFTAIASTVAPWFVALSCRTLGAPARASLAAACAVAVAPEIAVGLFALTPDVVLFFAWLGSLALFGGALLSPPRSTRAAAMFASAGVMLGVAAAAKASGLTLLVACALTLLAPSARRHARTVWPWLGFVLAAIVLAPVAAFEARSGWPMLRHRLVDTQHDAGVSLRNAAAVVLGQALYLSPVLFACGLVLLRDLWRARREDVLRTLLAAATVVPLGTLGALCLWSKVAEPHWLAPAWLALPLYFSVRPPSPGGPLGPRARTVAFVTALVASSLVYAWVLVPDLTTMIPAPSYDPRVDIANELYGWPEALADVQTSVVAQETPETERGDVVVLGAVWMVCAQLRAGLPLSTPVGCAGRDVADFATWYPQRTWANAEVVILVSDNRAPVDPARLLPDRVLLAERKRTVTRGGRVARVFTIQVLGRRARA